MLRGGGALRWFTGLHAITATRAARPHFYLNAHRFHLHRYASFSWSLLGPHGLSVAGVTPPACTAISSSRLLYTTNATPPSEDEKTKQLREQSRDAFGIKGSIEDELSSDEAPSSSEVTAAVGTAATGSTSRTAGLAEGQTDPAHGKTSRDQRKEGISPCGFQEDDAPPVLHAPGTFVPLSGDEAVLIRQDHLDARGEAAEDGAPRTTHGVQKESAVARSSSAQSRSGDPDSSSASAATVPCQRGTHSTCSTVDVAVASPTARPMTDEASESQTKRKLSQSVTVPPPPPNSTPLSTDASAIPIGRVVMKVWSYLWPRGDLKIRVLVVSSLTCVLVAKILKVAVPFWFKTIVDLLAPATATAEAVTVVGPLTIGVFGCVVAYGLCRITTSITEELKTVLFAPVGGHASTKLAMEMIDKLHSLDLNYHLNRETGVVSKDLDRGSRAFWMLAYALLFMVVPTTFEMCLVCGALNTQAGPQFIGIALVAVISYVTWTFSITNWRAKFRTRYNTLDSRVGGLIVDSLLNYETVKYFSTEQYESQRIRKETTNMNRQLVKLDQTMALLNFGQQFIFVAASVLSLYLATCGVISGALTVGDLVLVDALLMQLYMPLSYLGMIYREVQTSTQNMQAMIALLDVKAAVKDKPDAKEYQYINGTIELRDVTFEYRKELNRVVLRRLSLTIPGGKTVAFVGQSGSGKSTIFRLLFRFYDPTAGQILLDGQPLESLRTESVRNFVGVIPQDTVLFNETVKYNIRYGRMDATDDEVIAAAKAVSLHDTVMSMSEGYDSTVGERGLKLSGGERQRVSIARVVLSDPPILLADEATSALDSTTELDVMETLRNATGRRRRRTIILIAHRLTTVKEADIIFVLDGKGGLAEQGTHSELLRKNGLYASMWRQQLQDQREATATSTPKGSTATPTSETPTGDSSKRAS